MPVLGLILLSAFSTQLADEPPIVSVEWAVQRISQKLGTRVNVQRELKTLPVLFVPADEKPERLLRGLAEALRATVSTDGGNLVLARTPDDRERILAIDLNDMRDRLRSRMQQWDREATGAEAYGNSAKQVAAFLKRDAEAMRTHVTNPSLPMTRSTDPELLTPAGRMLKRFVQAVGIDQLATIKPGEVRVFSSKPTAVEAPLPGAEASIQAFVKEEQIFAADPALLIGPEDRQYSMEEFVLPTADEDLSDLTGTVTLSRSMRTINLSLEIFDRKGKRIARSFIWTYPDRDNTIPSQRANVLVKKERDKVVPLTSDGQAFLKALHGDPATIADPKTFWERMSHPDAFDPANFLVPTGLRRTSKGAMIAVIPDDITLAAQYSCTGEKLNTVAFDSLVDESNEWLDFEGVRLLRPRNPLSSERYIADRESLTRAFVTWRRTGQVDLRSWSVLVKEQGLAFPGVPREWNGILRRIRFPYFSDTHAYEELYAILGAIPDPQWPVRNGETSVNVSTGELGDRLWTFLLRCRTGIAKAANLPVIAEHPTFILPNGIPKGTRLSMRSETQWVSRSPSDSIGTGLSDLSIPNLLASIRSANSIPTRKAFLKPGSEALEGALSGMRIVPCRRQQTVFSIVFKPGVRMDRAFQTIGSPVGPASDFAHLPRDFRDALLEEWNRQVVAQ